MSQQQPNTATPVTPTQNFNASAGKEFTPAEFELIQKVMKGDGVSAAAENFPGGRDAVKTILSGLFVKLRLSPYDPNDAYEKAHLNLLRQKLRLSDSATFEETIRRTFNLSPQQVAIASAIFNYNGNKLYVSAKEIANKAGVAPSSAEDLCLSLVNDMSMPPLDGLSLVAKISVFLDRKYPAFAQERKDRAARLEAFTRTPAYH